MPERLNEQPGRVAARSAAELERLFAGLHTRLQPNHIIDLLLQPPIQFDQKVDRATRAPLAPWPETPPALRALVAAALGAGVSFGTRGNLILLAPPLVIDERELAGALALLDHLLGRFFP